MDLRLLTEEEIELFEERAAIKEYDANKIREEAELEAYEEILLRRSYTIRS